MPHLSKKLVKRETKERLEKNLYSILADTTSHAREKIFNELYTETERVMFAKRLGMLALLDRGIPSFTISKILSVSPSTVERFDVYRERGKYKETIRSLSRIRIPNRFIKLILDLTLPPLRGRRMSLTKLLEKL